MKCVYHYEVRAQCPVNAADVDLYRFTIEAESMIQVEAIGKFFAQHAGKQNVFQEDLTNRCAVTLGAKVTSVGWHSGIEVICTAP